MKSFEEFLLNEEKIRSTNKVEAVETIFEAIKKAFDQYGLTTRKFAWERINSSEGKNLVGKILNNPKIKISSGEIKKLAKN